tara:strand:+ start:199 stop:588 length:390 start_codon:yes stop_codon:yes gene_type:complete
MILFPLFIQGQNVDFSKLLERSTNNITSCDSLMNFCINEDDPRKIAYLGAGLMLKSKYSRKLKYFKKGKNKLDDIINKYPNFVEFRWIRYCIQKNTPRLLNYKQNIEIDKSIIQQNGTSYQKKILKDHD